MYYSVGKDYQNGVKQMPIVTPKSRGLGDTVKKVIEYVGLDKLVKNKKSCGCRKRQEKLNKLFPY